MKIFKIGNTAVFNYLRKKEIKEIESCIYENGKLVRLFDQKVDGKLKRFLLPSMYATSSIELIVQESNCSIRTETYEGISGDLIFEAKYKLKTFNRKYVDYEIGIGIIGVPEKDIVTKDDETLYHGWLANPIFSSDYSTKFVSSISV